ncbi:MAG: sulfatase-like hydrolase/transferase [Pseudomonadota bacterium]
MTVRNILFIMADQLRFDYLSCTGHPHLHTPNIDRIAAEGVRFSRAYVQSPVCGASRMCFYTGRYMQSHGAVWNGIPLKVGEMTLGDYLRPLGLRTALVGKTHMRADAEGMARLGIDPASPIGTLVTQCGFEPYARDDGLHGQGPDGWYDPAGPDTPYQNYLRTLGYDTENPWHDFANSARDDDGARLSGWLMKHCDQPAAVPDEHAETPWTTRQAMAFMEDAGDDPWCLHLSYIKPHWPYIVPAPYHNLYSAEHVLPVVRDDHERVDPHPVYAAFMNHRSSQAFSRQGVREAVIPAYMGLIKQLDDQIGELLDFMTRTGRLEDTLIVFTSDHGDFLGDHWLGEKDLFHEPSAKVPLLIRDPSADADATRGTVCDALVESIDLAATFVDVAGGAVQPHRLEGASLLPWLHNTPPETWRRHVISEYFYGIFPSGKAVHGDKIDDARLFMVFDGRYKLTHAPDMPPMLFDLDTDPDELRDLGRDPTYEAECERLMAALHRWGLRESQRQTRSAEQMLAMRGKSQRRGINVGLWDLDDLPEGDVRDTLA